MTHYDNNYLHDKESDRQAKIQAVAEFMPLSASELGECLSVVTQEQFDQFCGEVLKAADTNDELRYFVRNIVCWGVLLEKARAEVN